MRKYRQSSDANNASSALKCHVLKIRYAEILRGVSKYLAE